MFTCAEPSGDTRGAAQGGLRDRDGLADQAGDPVDGLDSFDDRDELVIYIRAQQAAEFRKKLSERTRASKVLMVENGQWVGGVAPIGYQLDRETHHLRVCPEEAKLVQKVIELSIEGKGSAKITHEINRLAFPPVTSRVYLPVPRWCAVTKRERKSKSCYLRIHHDECREHCGKCIAKFGDQARLVERNGIGRTTVRRIQNQDLYTGYMVWGRTKRSTDSTGFRGTNKSEWIHAEELTNDVLVTADELNAIKRNAANNRLARTGRGMGTCLLNGVIFCGECGASMAGHSDCQTWKAYYCSTRKYKGNAICDAPTLNVNVIEPYVEERIRGFVSSIDDESLFDGDHWKHDSALVTNLRKEIARLERLVDDNGQAAEKVLSLFEVGDTAPSIVRSRLETLERDSSKLEDQLTDRRGQLEGALDDIPTREELEEFARDFDEIWTVADRDDKKQIVHAVIERITVYATGRIKVIFAF